MIPDQHQQIVQQEEECDRERDAQIEAEFFAWVDEQLEMQAKQIPRMQPITRPLYQINPKDW